MKNISTAKLRRWVLVGLGVGTLVSLLLGILLTCDLGGLLLNLGAEFGGALATYGLLELFIKRREEEEAKEKEREARKAELIAQMGSSVKDLAAAAAEEMARHGWHDNGSLQGASLTEANLEGARLYGADLQGAVLLRANLQEARLMGADLQGAVLAGADLQGAVLFQANLQGAFLLVANLQGADLGAANLQGARLLLANLQGARFDGYITLPDGTKWTPDTDMARFTDPDHPDFWQPDA